MPDERDPEDETQQEIRDQAAGSEDDPETSREGLETELMDKGASDEGEHLGQPTP